MDKSRKATARKVGRNKFSKLFDEDLGSQFYQNCLKKWHLNGI